MRKTLVLEFFDASAPMRQAATEEVIIRCFDGIGPIGPDIFRITVEFNDPRVSNEGPAIHDSRRTQLDVVADLLKTAAKQPGSCSGVVAMPEQSEPEHQEPRTDDWAV